MTELGKRTPVGDCNDWTDDWVWAVEPGSELMAICVELDVFWRQPDLVAGLV